MVRVLYPTQKFPRKLPRPTLNSCTSIACEELGIEILDISITWGGRRKGMDGLFGGFYEIWWFPKMVVPSNYRLFPTKNVHFGVFRGYHHLRKHPHTSIQYDHLFFVFCWPFCWRWWICWYLEVSFRK